MIALNSDVNSVERSCKPLQFKNTEIDSQKEISTSTIINYQNWHGQNCSAILNLDDGNFYRFKDGQLKDIARGLFYLRPDGKKWRTTYNDGMLVHSPISNLNEYIKEPVIRHLDWHKVGVASEMMK